MFKNLRELIASMPDEKTCREYIAQQRWPDGVICPYCGCDKIYRIVERDRYKCASKDCAKKFSVTIGLVFQDSKIALSKWLTAVYLATAHKKGISSYQLGKDIGVSQKSAWFMLHRIREGLRENAPEMLEGIIESDETYMSRKFASDFKGLPPEEVEAIRSNNYNTKNKGAVVGLAERKTKKVRITSFDSNNAENLRSVIKKNVAPNSDLFTDESFLYRKGLEEFFHATVNHSKREWVRGIIHTNNVENFWSVMKRGVYGIYHQISYKHLQRYCDEYSYRYNSRKLRDDQRFIVALQGLQGRLSYNKLVHGKEDKIKGNPKKEK
jgi:hypothetical protein